MDQRPGRAQGERLASAPLTARPSRSGRGLRLFLMMAMLSMITPGRCFSVNDGARRVAPVIRGALDESTLPPSSWRCPEGEWELHPPVRGHAIHCLPAPPVPVRIAYGYPSHGAAALPDAPTPWRVATRMGEREVFASTRAATLALLITLSTLFFAALAGILLLWWRQQRGGGPEPESAPALGGEYDFFATAGNDIMLLADEAGHILEANDRAAERYGYSRAALRGMSIGELRHPDCPLTSPTPWERLEPGSGMMYETVHRTREGERMPVEVSARAIAMDGRTYFHAIVRDITKRKAAEAALRRSDERLASILEGVGDGYWDVDLSGGEFYFSPRVADLLGYGPAEIQKTAKHWQELVHPSDRERVERELEEHLQGRKDRFIAEFRVRRKDGAYVRVLARGGIVQRADDGRALRMAGSLTDIRVQERDTEQMNLCAQVFANAGEAIFITDAERRIISVNPAFCDITGYDLEEVRGKHPQVLASNEHDDAFYHDVWAAVDEAGHWQGEMWERRKDGEIFPMWTAITAARGHDGRLQNYIAVGSDISERKAAEERIRFLAHHDALTRLPNRALLQDRLSLAVAHARRTSARVGILFIDLDRFKTVNDSLGHQQGDRLLMLLAERLRRSVRADDTVSRYGGDEFVVLLPDLRQPGDAAHVAQKIIEVVRKPFVLDGNELTVTSSIGIAIAPDDGTDSDTLIRNADAAMYNAKEKGRANFQFFTGELNQRAATRLSAESSLRQAVDHGEFVLHYQPQIDTRSGKLVGLEALIRWRRGGDLVAPIDFISLAEDTGLILPIGEWVLREACRQQAAWQAGDLKNVPVAINLSATQFRRQDALATLKRIVSGNCNPRGLEIELTEASIMQEAETSVGMLHGLKEMGIGLAIDDFGTGYSSLSYLHRFPIDRLKVDQSFVHDLASDPADRAITEAIIALAKSLGLRVIAEGVENPEEIAFLRSRECDEVQGFYFSPPLPPDALLVWWKRRRQGQQGGREA